ncbi:MAG: hypothetical protein HC906_12950 [Bacteroidales bacterium]|nr:hypothetical protein [Bacteroidales bacterium]
MLSENKEPIMKNEELMSYVMSDLIFRANGRILLIAEQVFNQSFNTYNNLIVSCFDTTGQLYWTKIIQKKQDFDVKYLTPYELDAEEYRDYVIETGNIDVSIENYCSYALLAPLNENEIVLFYNDNIKNLEDGKKLRNFGRPRKSYVAAVYIDEYGNTNTQVLLKWQKKMLYPEPIRYYNNLKETLIIPAFRGRKFYYYKITANF